MRNLKTILALIALVRAQAHAATQYETDPQNFLRGRAVD